MYRSLTFVNIWSEQNIKVMVAWMDGWICFRGSLSIFCWQFNRLFNTFKKKTYLWNLFLCWFKLVLAEKVLSQKSKGMETPQLLNVISYVMESSSLPHNLQMCDLCCLGTPFGFLPFGIIFWPFSIIDLTFASSAWLVWDFYCRINLQRGILFGYLIYLMGRHHKITALVNWLQKLRFLFVRITWCLPSRALCLNAYLGAPNMVKWGVPEKILQNVVQTRWS